MIFSKRTWIEIIALSIFMFVLVFSFLDLELWLRITLSILIALLMFSGSSFIAIHAQFDDREFHERLWKELQRKDYTDKWGY